jgi:CubicO group peptidase (beta-lactamase class C family)
VRPEEVGLSSERLQRIEQHLRERYVDQGRIAGAVTLVARHGQVAYLSAVGQRDRERQRSMTEDTLFRIYSMTKPVTSVAMMILVEEARCALNDPVSRYIPAWENLRVLRYGAYPDFMTDAPRRAMTIRDLLMHTSGLTYGFARRDAIDAAYRRVGIGGVIPGEARPSTLKDMTDKLAEIPLLFSPGTQWNYSVSTDVLGHLVEIISGKTFDRFLRDRIFDPLGMRHTDFRVPPGCGDRFAANYRREGGKLVLADDPTDSQYLAEQTFFSGGGGLVSTAEDYRRFCQMLLNGGHYDGKRILGKKTIELMTMNHLPENQDLSALASGSFSETTYDGVGFGLGFAVLIDIAKRQSHGSLGEYYWGGAASTAFWIDPVEDLIAIFMTQLMPSTAYNFRGQLRNLIYSAIID